MKTRIGTRYPSMFEDDIFVESINIAKMHVYAACLSDFTIFAVAHATREQPVTDEERGGMEMTCYRLGLARNEDQAPPEFNAEEWTDAFAQRLEGTDWPFGALKRENFKQSPLNLVKWAPIAPQLKQYDTEIVEKLDQVRLAGDSPAISEAARSGGHRRGDHQPRERGGLIQDNALSGQDRMLAAYAGGAPGAAALIFQGEGDRAQ